MTPKTLEIINNLLIFWPTSRYQLSNYSIENISLLWSKNPLAKMCHKYYYYKIYILPKLTKHLTITNIQSNNN
jgi:hypothetical protein